MRSATSRPRLWRLHASLVAAATICISAFLVELSRALGGNALSWAYVFEWPLLLAYSFYLWHRLVRDEHESAPPALPDETPQDAAARSAWNEYLARLHAGELDDPGAGGNG
jgi:hypothetical protein